MLMYATANGLVMRFKDDKEPNKKWYPLALITPQEQPNDNQSSLSSREYYLTAQQSNELTKILNQLGGITITQWFLLYDESQVGIT